MSAPQSSRNGSLSLDLEDLDDAGFFLRSLIRSWMGSNRHLDADYVTNFSACSKLLKENPAFYTALRVAATTKDYRPIQDSPLLLRPNTRDARDFLERHRSGMKKCVDGAPEFVPWEPKLEDDDLRSHLTGLDLYASGDEPSLLLDRLGKFHDDPVLRNRVRSIFVRGQDTFLVNTSGSGKTRLTFEGLCQEWGFYFSAVTESGYSAGELNAILSTEIRRQPGFTAELSSGSERFSEQLQSNQKIAAHHFNAALLARLLMFQMFVEIMHETVPAPEHKMRWLLFQLRPRLGGSYDSIAQLTFILSEDDDTYTKENILDSIGKIRDTFGGDLHLFYVLDEAQAPATLFPSAFYTGGQFHPILPEIIRAWLAHPVDNFEASMVISGIRIPKDMFDAEGNSSLRHRWTSDTGAFDGPAQRRYIESFLPSSIADSQTADRLISRAWNWVRGRHRFTSAFVTLLLINGFLPADAILDDYFNALAHLPPTDSDTDLYWIESFVKVIALGRYSMLDFAVLGEHPSIKNTIRQILFHYLLTSKHPKPIGAEGIELVSEGLGRFCDTEANEVLVDEPIILGGAANWLLGCSESGHGDYTYYDILLRDPLPDSKTLAKCVAYYLAHTFDETRRLCDIFTFPGSCPKWARQNASLVAIHSTGAGMTVSSPETFPTLATITDSMADTISWLQHREPTPFCLPSSESSPDLIFILKMEDGAFIWVFLRATVSADKLLKESDVKDILLKLQDDNLFCNEDDERQRTSAKDALKGLPNLSSRLGPFGVLRVVASFPAHPQIGRLPLKTTRHAASLNMRLFKRVNESIRAVDMVNNMASAVAGLPPSKRKADVDENNRRKNSKRRIAPPSTPAPAPRPPGVRTRSQKRA
ncbi:hypothetical protein DFH07DRAFT_1063020 [Mycena maculata]|uniref:Uncharacterized protein n=1 Tax=Mycena maculata TaxID=230809 RepID=A0AAD7N4R8_9AGAR|nr:hypothetical protein DFH07DRAFT_1063020 [Mycena maculata]